MRYLTGLALIAFFFAVSVAGVEANGGTLVHREQQGGYDIAVTVWPPEPKTGLLVFTVLIQAVASTNGSDEAHLAPVSSDLTLHGAGPSGAEVGPFQPQTVLPGFSHFDVRIPVGREGEWVFTLAVSGPLGQVTTNVPLEVLPGDDSPLFMWSAVLAGTIGVLAACAVLVAVVRRFRRSPVTHERR